VKIERLAPFITLTLFILFLCSCIPSAGEAEGWPGVSSHNGLLYTAAGDGSVMALNSSARLDGLAFPSLADGEWYFRIEVPGGGGVSCGPSSVAAAFYGAPVVGEDLVYVGTYSGDVLAMSPSARSQNLTFPQRGSDEWVCPLPGNIVGQPVIDGNTLYVPSSDGRVYGLDAIYGDVRWKSGPLDDKLWTGPAIEGDTIYVSTFEDYVYGLPTEGASLGNDVEPSWAFKGDAGFVSSPVLRDDMVFVGSFDRNVYGVRVGESEATWKFAGGNWFWAAPVIDEGVVYAGCFDGKIYALDAETGDELWEFDTASQIVASPVLVGDLLVVACDSGEVYILRTDTVVDERLASGPVSVDAPIRGSICAQEGTAYVRAQNDRLYALDVERGRIIWEFALTTE
jgi:outer membrane protein assembly factor BamB